MSRLKLAAIVALIAGPGMIVINYLETTQKQKIAREGIETAAFPMSKSISRGRRSARTYKLTIRYLLEGGQTENATVRVSHELFDKAESEPIMVAKYLKEDPKRVIIVGEPLSYTELYYAGAAVFLFGLGGTWWCFIRKKPEVETVEWIAPSDEPRPTP